MERLLCAQAVPDEQEKPYGFLGDERRDKAKPLCRCTGVSKASK